MSYWIKLLQFKIIMELFIAWKEEMLLLKWQIYGSVISIWTKLHIKFERQNFLKQQASHCSILDNHSLQNWTYFCFHVTWRWGACEYVLRKIWIWSSISGVVVWSISKFFFFLGGGNFFEMWNAEWNRITDSFLLN